MIALAAIPSIRAAIVPLLWIPLGLVGALIICALVLLLGVAIGAAGWWTMKRAADTVLGPAHDL